MFADHLLNLSLIIIFLKLKKNQQLITADIYQIPISAIYTFQMDVQFVDFVQVFCGKHWQKFGTYLQKIAFF